MFRGSSRTCFVAGTPVLMADGSSKAIEDVKAGDKVLSRDEASGKVVAKEVVDIKVRIAPATLVIEVEGGTRVETTPEHPFFVEGTGWTPAGRLAIGNAIVTRAGPSLKIVRIETKEKPATVYNFEVAGTHTYFVGNGEKERGVGKKEVAGQDGGGLWVHNDCEPRWPKMDKDGQLSLFSPETRYNRDAHYGRTPTRPQKRSASPGVFDHDPPLVEHYYEGTPDGGIPGFMMTPADRKAYGRSLSSGRSGTRSYHGQGGDTSAYSERMRKHWGLPE